MPTFLNRIRFFGSLTKLELWFFSKVVRKAVKQGSYHTDNLITLYRIIDLAAQMEFAEDSPASLEQYLAGLHAHAHRLNMTGLHEVTK